MDGMSQGLLPGKSRREKGLRNGIAISNTEKCQSIIDQRTSQGRPESHEQGSQEEERECCKGASDEVEQTASEGSDLHIVIKGLTNG